MKRTVAAAVASLALIGVPIGSAQNPNDTQYGNVAEEVSQEEVAGVESPAAPPGDAVEVDTLPFTGADLGIALLVGTGAIAGGFAIRRLGRKQTDG